MSSYSCLGFFHSEPVYVLSQLLHHLNTSAQQPDSALWGVGVPKDPLISDLFPRWQQQQLLMNNISATYFSHEHSTLAVRNISSVSVTWKCSWI